MTERLDQLERRVQRLEDEQAITQLIASYGPWSNPMRTKA